MTVVKYIQDQDELHIRLSECNQPQCIKLDNGIELEFDGEELSNIVLPNFSQQILHTHLNVDSEIEYSHSVVQDEKIILFLKCGKHTLQIPIDFTNL